MDEPSQATDRAGAPSSLLVIPAVKSAYYQNALQLSQDLVGIVLDLEDSISAKAKGEARRTIISNIPALWKKAPDKCWLRINNSESPAYREDLALVEELAKSEIFPSVVYPKYSCVADLREIRTRLRNDSQKLFVGIESFAAIENVTTLLASDLGILGATVGAEDLSAWLGIERPQRFYSNPLFAYSASRVACACHASNIEFWGNIWPFMVSQDTRSCWLGEIQDDIHLGARGKIVFHPDQIRDVNWAFNEASRQKEPILDKLRQLLNAAQENGSLVALHDSKMIDGPEIARARRLLKRFPDVELSKFVQLFDDETPTK